MAMCITVNDEVESVLVQTTALSVGYEWIDDDVDVRTGCLDLSFDSGYDYPIVIYLESDYTMRYASAGWIATGYDEINIKGELV